MNEVVCCKNQKSHSRDKGFSLIEVLVISALLGSLILTSASLFDQHLKISNYQDFKFETRNLVYEVENNLSIGSSCDNSLVSTATNVNQAHVPSISDSSGNVFVAEGQAVGNLTVASISTENDTVPAAGGPGLINLILTIESKKQVLGNKTLVRKFPVKVEANAAGAIQNCGTGGGAVIWDNCYIKQDYYPHGAYQEVTCDNPGDKMVSAMCFPIGTEDGPQRCDLRMNSIYIQPTRDGWGVKLQCCPTE